MDAVVGVGISHNAAARTRVNTRRGAAVFYAKLLNIAGWFELESNLPRFVKVPAGDPQRLREYCL